MKDEHENIRKIYSSDESLEKARQADHAIPRLMGCVGTIAFVLGLMIMAISDNANIFMLGLTGLGFLLLVAFVLIDFQFVKAFLTSRTTVYSTNFLIVVGTFLGIIIIVNAVASNHYIAIDLTSEKVNSLSGQTLKILSDIKSSKREINVIVFMSKTDKRRIDVNLLLENYCHFTPTLKYSFADYEVQKKLAVDKGVDRPCILLETTETSKKVYDFDERSMTAGLLALIRPEQKMVGLVTGHGEFNVDGEGGRSISKFVSNLEKENYIVRSVDIASENGIPDETSLILIIGAGKQYNEKEIQALQDFEKKGGAIAIFLEPFATDGLSPVYASWGIENPPDMVIDPTENYFQDETVPIIKKYMYHPITSGFMDDQQALKGYAGGIVTPTATSLKIKDPPPQGVEVEPLAITSDKSWGETSAETMELNQETDIIGPLAVVAVGTRHFASEGESSEIKSRFMVAGDADFLTDANLGEGSNFDFIFNSINWLNEDESLIEMRTPINLEHRIDLENNQAKAVQLINLFIPLLIAGLGIAKWLKRR